MPSREILGSPRRCNRSWIGERLAGAVALVASPEKVLSVDAVGYSDVGAKVAMKPDALFWIASMSKPITATALMILVDEGKVQIDDPAENLPARVQGATPSARQERRPGDPQEAREADHRA